MCTICYQQAISNSCGSDKRGQNTFDKRMANALSIISNMQHRKEMTVDCACDKNSGQGWKHGFHCSKNAIHKHGVLTFQIC
jgi:hypothetical protein